jgi:hypothetical protein
MDYTILQECTKIPNNRFTKCPALMSDSRTFTDYRSSCYVNALLQNKNNIQSSDEYRTFLTNNGVKILESSSKYFKHKTDCNINHNH